MNRRFFRGGDDEDPFREFRFFFGGLGDDDDDGDDDYMDTFSQGFHFSSAETLFRQMQEMMDELHGASRRGGGAMMKMTSPREQMLKDPNDPFWRQFQNPDKDKTNKPTLDTDLDTSLSDVIKRVPEVQATYSSVSVSTVRRPDGTVETTTRKRDSHGNETVTVTRSTGGETPVSTTEEKSPFEQNRTSMWKRFLKTIWPLGKSS
ncbi:HCLS1-associated protein X-1-like [Oscarella lobularis]|uniref:HCLS1-associated protein X-1-like n=1 Tax=Oscarella lobularis TaxID=121494 RepID=UPI003313B382